jgi:hypothetical protein
MLIELADETIAFMMVVAYQGSAEDAEEAFRGALTKQFNPSDYTIISPMEKPDYYITASLMAANMMARNGINWRWLDKSFFLIDTTKRVSGANVHIHRVIRLITLSERMLKKMAEVSGGSARKRLAGAKGAGNGQVDTDG